MDNRNGLTRTPPASTEQASGEPVWPTAANPERSRGNPQPTPSYAAIAALVSVCPSALTHNVSTGLLRMQQLLSWPSGCVHAFPQLPCLSCGRHVGCLCASSASCGRVDCDGSSPISERIQVLNYFWYEST